MSIKEALLAPYKARKVRKLKEFELNKRDSINTKEICEEQKVLTVERDIEFIMSSYLSDGSNQGVKISMAAEYMEYTESYLKSQGIPFIRLSESQLIIKGDQYDNSIG